MCGIAGFMPAPPKPGPGARVDAEALQPMSAALAHRGPDGEGEHVTEKIALFHRRLSIIDVDGGAQPLHAPNGNALVANGEIYNFIELRETLADASFATRSDSEVPLYLYGRDGAAYADDLRGMYALAIYDPIRDQLVLTRDPFGIKPLYYAETDAGLAFASEPRALFASGQLAPAVDMGHAASLLNVAFTVGEATCHVGVKRLLPGETLIVREGRAAERRLRTIEPEPAPGRSFDTAVADLDALMAETITLHTRSDVPYGVFLSGGVDSCSVVAAMARAGIKGFPCYTARFPGSELFDETEIARAVAKHAGAEHVEVEITEATFWRGLAKAVEAMDDLTLDPAMVGFHVLAERASRDVKVVLGGDGGDEIFGGYRRYEKALLPGFLRRKGSRTKGRFASDMLSGDVSGWRDAYARVERETAAQAASPLQAMQLLDLADNLPHHHLLQLDRCLMASGVEGRTPFLEPRVAAFGLGLPDAHKVRPGQGKRILRAWLARALPEAQPYLKKRGFSAPVGEWMARRRAAIAAFATRQDGARERFTPDFLNDLGAANTDQFWGVFLYALWHERHVAGGEAGREFCEALARRAN